MVMASWKETEKRSQSPISDQNSSFGGHLGGSVCWDSHSWFQLRSWSRGHEIEPPSALSWVWSLFEILSPSPSLSTPCSSMLMFSLSLSLPLSFKKKGGWLKRNCFKSPDMVLWAYSKWRNIYSRISARGTWVVQWLSVCLQLEAWPRGPGIQYCIRLPTGSRLLPLPVSLLLSLSLMSNFLKT